MGVNVRDLRRPAERAGGPRKIRGAWYLELGASIGMNLHDVSATA